MTEAEWLACIDPEPMLDFVCRQGRLAEKPGAFNAPVEPLRELIDQLGRPATVYHRKRRLFACACCRRVWPLLEGPARAAVEAAERFADGEATEDELRAASRSAEEAGRGLTRAANVATAAALAAGRFFDVRFSASHVASDGGFTRPADLIVYAMERADDPALAFAQVGTTTPLRGRRGRRSAAQSAEQSAQCGLLRCLFGNPFQSVTVDPAWLAGNGGAVAKLAQAAYDQRSLHSGELDAARLAVLADALEVAGCSVTDILAHLRGPGPHVWGCWVVDLLTGRQ
jgi:hypothetical protein